MSELLGTPLAHEGRLSNQKPSKYRFLLIYFPKRSFQRCCKSSQTSLPVLDFQFSPSSLLPKVFSKNSSHLRPALRPMAELTWRETALMVWSMNEGMNVCYHLPLFIDTHFFKGPPTLLEEGSTRRQPRIEIVSGKRLDGTKQDPGSPHGRRNG